MKTPQDLLSLRKWAYLFLGLSLEVRIIYNVVSRLPLRETSMGKDRGVGKGQEREV